MASGLTDMEELLGRVSNAAIADYLKEALACYGTGAHRACIVMTFIAVFEDLRSKTKQLVGVSKQAKAISKEIEDLADGQKPFETQLVERLQSSELITELQGQRLKQIINHRNKAAHPSGHHASAEEARFVFFEAIDKYLSQPILNANHAVDRVIDQLPNSNYFPDNNMANILAITTEETKGIHAAAYPYLINKIVELITDPDEITSKNSRFMMTGMANISEMQEVIADRFIKPKCSDANYGDEIAAVLSSGPSIIKFTNDATKTRLNSLIEKVTEETKNTVPVTRMKHPLTVVKAMLSVIEDDIIFPTFQGSVSKIISKYWSNPVVIDSLSKSDKAFSQLCDYYISLAGSSNFSKANEFSQALPDLDQKLAETVSKQVSLKIIGSVYSAAEIGSWRAQSLRSDRFASIKALRSQAVSFIDEDMETATNTLHQLGVGMSAGDFKAEYLSDQEGNDED